MKEETIFTRLGGRLAYLLTGSYLLIVIT